MLRDAILAFFIRGFGAVAALMMNVALARSLPVEEAGLYFLGLAIVTMLANVGTLGLNNTILRFVGAHAAENAWPEINALTRKAWRWAGSALAAVSVLVSLGAPWLAEHVFDKQAFGPVLRYLAPAILPLGMAILIAHQMQAVRRITKSIYLLSIGVPAGVCAGLAIYPLHQAVDAALLFVGSASLAMLLGVRWWLDARGGKVVGEFSGTVLVASCLPLWLTVLMSQALQWSSQFVAGMWVPAEEVAYLAAAQRTAMLVSFILIAVNLVVAPRFAALHKQGQHQELRRLVAESMRAMIAIAVPIVVLICLLPETVMKMFGPDFVKGSTLLVILAIGQLLNVVTGSVGYLLTMSGHERDMRNMILVSAPLGIVLALVLTFAYGVTGSALATAAALSVQKLGEAWIVRKRFGFNPLAFWRKY